MSWGVFVSIEHSLLIATFCSSLRSYRKNKHHTMWQSACVLQVMNNFDDFLFCFLYKNLVLKPYKMKKKKQVIREIDRSPMKFFLHHQCRNVSSKGFCEIWSIMSSNLLLMWITTKTDFVFLNFQNKYTRQKKLFFSPWRTSLHKVNPRKHSPGTFPKLSYLVTQVALLPFFFSSDFPAVTKKTNLYNESIQMWRYLISITR